MTPIIQYLKDTRAELRHVAWPTQMQTVVYTILVVGISLGLAAYLGLFDFLFTTGLSHIVSNLPENPTAAKTQTTTTPSAPVNTSTSSSPLQLNITPTK